MITIVVSGGVVNSVYTEKGGEDILVVDYDNIKAGGTVDRYLSDRPDKNYREMMKELREKYHIPKEDFE